METLIDIDLNKDWNITWPNKGGGETRIAGEMSRCFQSDMLYGLPGACLQLGSADSACRLV